MNLRAYNGIRDKRSSLSFLMDFNGTSGASGRTLGPASSKKLSTPKNKANMWKQSQEVKDRKEGSVAFFKILDWVLHKAKPTLVYALDKNSILQRASVTYNQKQPN